DVRDHLVRLDAQAKVRRRFLNPVLDRGLFHQLPESKVHFNRIQLSGVMAEKLFLRELGRIEVRLPRWISPPGRSDKQSRHRNLSKQIRSGRDYTLRLTLRADVRFAVFFAALRGVSSDSSSSCACAAIEIVGSASAVAARLLRSGSLCFNSRTG